MSRTHKPVFVAALVGVGRRERDGGLAGRQWIRAGESGSIGVGLGLAAARLVKFYRDMAAGLGARHAAERMADVDYPSRDILNIAKAINGEIEAGEGECIRGAAAPAGADLRGRPRRPGGRAPHAGRPPSRSSRPTGWPRSGKRSWPGPSSPR